MKKKSNAFLSKGTAEIMEVNSLTEFYHKLQELQSNEAIILGVVK
ncbi:MAG: hypothetical protein RBR70_04010 [Arcobacter sp.]|nr:hypothetical protein [Arcobacter sp.]MDY3204222.1 hypothetical protein [Arcobacter sp.]